MNMHKKHKGFTLIELVVAMVIAAILAAIAIPAYSNYVLKARRAEAKSALLDMASLEERLFSTQNTYSITPSDLGYPGAVPFAAPFPIGSGYYNITNMQLTAAIAPVNSTSVGTPATYTITASAIGDQLKDTSCLTFTITSAGLQTSAPSTTCWQ
jgi:type IV pilus assembly protein PilE